MRVLQTYLAKIEWQVLGLSDYTHFEDEYFLEILESLEKKCQVIDFNSCGEFVYFEVAFETRSFNEARELTQRYTQESFISVLKNSEMLLIDIEIKQI